MRTTIDKFNIPSKIQNRVIWGVMRTMRINRSILNSNHICWRSIDDTPAAPAGRSIPEVLHPLHCPRVQVRAEFDALLPMLNFYVDMRRRRKGRIHE
jgi:hypothetical protein